MNSFNLLKIHKLVFLIFTITSEPVLSGTNIVNSSEPALPLSNKHTLSDTYIPKLDPSLAIEAVCGNNEHAQKLARLIQSSENQQRQLLHCNEKLNEIALIKANLIQQNQHVWHNAGNMYPNQLLRHHGFKLPRSYPTFDNQVEAIAGGEATPEFLLEDFLNSTPHRQLLLGENDFFHAQDQMGVAYLKDLSTEHQHYWVVIIAKAQEKTIFKQEPVAEVSPPLESQNRKRLKNMKQRMYRNKVKSTRRY